MIVIISKDIRRVGYKRSYLSSCLYKSYGQTFMIKKAVELQEFAGITIGNFVQKIINNFTIYQPPQFFQSFYIQLSNLFLRNTVNFYITYFKLCCHRSTSRNKGRLFQPF